MPGEYTGVCLFSTVLQCECVPNGILPIDIFNVRQSYFSHGINERQNRRIILPRAQTSGYARIYTGIHTYIHIAMFASPSIYFSTSISTSLYATTLR